MVAAEGHLEPYARAPRFRFVHTFCSIRFSRLHAIDMRKIELRTELYVAVLTEGVQYIVCVRLLLYLYLIDMS